MSQLADHEPVTVPDAMDQEEVARLFRKYDLLAVPVVNAERVLVGRIAVEEIVDVVDAEAASDTLMLAGTGEGERRATSTLQVVQRRLPWLSVTLFGTLISGSVIGWFENVLAQTAILAMFIPAVMAIGGSVGMQVTAVTVRRLASKGVGRGTIWRVIGRELGAGVLVALVAGLFGGAVAVWWLPTVRHGLVVGTSMTAAVLIASMLGLFIPLGFDRRGVDPAVASGPLLTTLNDILGVLIYFILIVLWLGS